MDLIRQKKVKKELNETEDRESDADNNNFPIITHLNNISHSIFSNVEVKFKETISNFTIQLDFMVINFTSPTILNKSSLSIRECYIVKAMTWNQTQKTLWIHRWSIRSLQW